MGLFSHNKKGVSYNYKTPQDQARAARHLISRLNRGQIDLGDRTYEPSANTMLPDENGVPVFVEYIGLVDGMMKWKQPDRFTEGRFDGGHGDGGRKKDRKRKGGSREDGLGRGIGLNGFYEPHTEPLDIPLYGGKEKGSGVMEGGNQTLHDDPRPVFGGGIGGAPGSFTGGSFGMSGEMGSQRSFSQHGHMGPLPGFGQSYYSTHYSQNHYHPIPRFGDIGPASSKHSRSHNGPRSSSYHSSSHDFDFTQSLPQAQTYSPFQSPFQSPFHSPFHSPSQHHPAHHFPYHHEPASAPPPLDIVDPLATQQGPLGMHGKRAHVPGQTELQKKFSGSQTDPEQRYEYLDELEKLRKENEKRGVRG